MIKLAKEKGLLQSDDLDHLIDRRLVLGRIRDAQISEAVLLIVRDKLIQTVHPDDMTSDQSVGPLDDFQGVLQEISTHPLVGVIGPPELT